MANDKMANLLKGLNKAKELQEASYKVDSKQPIPSVDTLTAPPKLITETRRAVSREDEDLQRFLNGEDDDNSFERGVEEIRKKNKPKGELDESWLANRPSSPDSPPMPKYTRAQVDAMPFSESIKKGYYKQIEVMEQWEKQNPQKTSNPKAKKVVEGIEKGRRIVHQEEVKRKPDVEQTSSTGLNRSGLEKLIREICKQNMAELFETIEGEGDRLSLVFGGKIFVCEIVEVKSRK
jgi:hypothetical protein